MASQSRRLWIVTVVIASVALASPGVARQTTQRVLYTKTALGDEITRSVLNISDATEHTPARRLSRAVMSLRRAAQSARQPADA